MFKIYRLIFMEVWLSENYSRMFKEGVEILKYAETDNDMSNFLKQCEELKNSFVEGETQFTFVKHKLRYSLEGCEYTKSNEVYRKIVSFGVEEILRNNMNIIPDKGLLKRLKHSAGLTPEKDSFESNFEIYIITENLMDYTANVTTYHTWNRDDVTLYYLVEKLKKVIDEYLTYELKNCTNAPKTAILNIFKTASIVDLDSYRDANSKLVKS